MFGDSAESEALSLDLFPSMFARKPTFGLLQRIYLRNFHGEFIIAFRTIEILQLEAVTTGR